MIIAEHQTLSAGNVTTANIVRGLRLINDVDWTVWFEKVSRVDALLREQALFADLDFHSRDLYRAEIEELARGSGITEYAVAEQAIAKAKEAADIDPDTSDIGFFLVGGHRDELEAAIRYKPPFATRFKRAYRKAGWAGILGPAAAIAAILLSMIAAALGNMACPAAIAVMLVLLVLPAMEAGLSLFNKLVLASDAVTPWSATIQARRAGRGAHLVVVPR